MHSINTQISGKYSPDNVGLFEFKRQLVGPDISVSFPAGDSVLEYECGFAITTPEEAIIPFHVTEIKLLRDIQSNPVHITYNLFKGHGYIGESTGVETLFAILNNKPVAVFEAVEDCVFSPYVSPVVAELMGKYSTRLSIIERPEEKSIGVIRDSLGSLACQEIDYGMTLREQRMVMDETLQLTEKYRVQWGEYQQLPKTPLGMVV